MLLVSVVIPVLDERSALETALEGTRGPGVERIVVDGGSCDGSAGRARELGAERILVTPPGRAGQLEAGRRVASGDVILFLHADTRLEPGWLVALRRALEDPRVAGGAFRLRFDSSHPLYRLIELGARLRVRLGGLPYGDQALFARAELLATAGGIPPVPIFEDLDLAARVRAAGRFVVLPLRVWTSPRRYEAGGIVRTWLRNSVALAAYGLDLDRTRVARWYRRQPER
ncbi:MAG: TIGR04283 family arsenosugar biosynthesis glycosyltransferase [Myxococcota bacterium]